MQIIRITTVNSSIQLVGIVLAVALVAIASAQNDGRYRPTPAVPYYQRPRLSRPTVSGEGRYRPSNDGRYRGASDGRYRGGNDGKYVHQDVPYVHDDRAGGQYEGDNDRFGPSSGGAGAFGGAGRLGVRGNALGSVGSSGSRAGLALRTTTTPRPTPKTTVVVTPALPKGSGSGEGGNGWRILQLFDKEEKDGYQYM